MIHEKIKLREKIGYALGDGAANIAWRGVTTFLFVFYTDVFGLTPATVGLLMLVARFSDGISDVLMGVVGDRTKSKYGKFRPWILWTAIPLGVILSMLFTAPDLSESGKIVYAYSTYIIFTLVYTANNIPYGALMAVMTGDNRERASIGSYRMVGAFAGGMIVQGALLFLVAYFGNINPSVNIVQVDDQQYRVAVASDSDYENVNIKTDDGIAQISWADAQNCEMEPSNNVSFSMTAGEQYEFMVTGQADVVADDIVIINQKKGYSYSIYLLSVFLALFMFLTFISTKERVQPPAKQENNLKQDLKDLMNNRPWFILLLVGIMFNVYNAAKQSIVIIYFTHYLQNQLLAASYMIVLMLASIGGAMITSPLSKKFGKKNLFIGALLFSGITNAFIFFCGRGDYSLIFILGAISEMASAILPTLFFAMLADAADFSEFRNRRRATGLVYSAGSFATKFGGGIAGALIGIVLAMFSYDGQDQAAIQGAIPGIKMLMSWIPMVIAVVGALIMTIYPLSQRKMDDINQELDRRRAIGE